MSDRERFQAAAERDERERVTEWSQRHQNSDRVETIKVDRQAALPLLTEGEIAVEIMMAYGHNEISDTVALSLADQWKSSGRVGSVLARLATTGEAPVTALLDDISATRREATTTYDRLSLDMLSTWTINHPSRPPARSMWPRVIDGRMSWACCVSNIGPQCEHTRPNQHNGERY